MSEDQAQDIERQAARLSYQAGFGVCEWESFLTREQRIRLIELAEAGFGTLANEPHTLKLMKDSLMV